jgi:hypothetical protein
MPLGLTRGQVQYYRLPRIPIKESDTRKAGFEERYGEGRWNSMPWRHSILGN